MRRGARLGSSRKQPVMEAAMDGIIYLVGLVVVVMAVLSFLGLH